MKSKKYLLSLLVQSKQRKQKYSCFLNIEILFLKHKEDTFSKYTFYFKVLSKLDRTLCFVPEKTNKKKKDKHSLNF